ncbi:unnamed protein product [Cladocopium goreaui]|uniref:Uncharacterized protein n=1 Tax=Cladocopium goreaui TaxID=2562237 RepID=A0A9P1C6A3_9DINO|nr:unnamed protein product [Cladocopium goreaui]
MLARLQLNHRLELPKCKGRPEPMLMVPPRKRNRAGTELCLRRWKRTRRTKWTWEWMCWSRVNPWQLTSRKMWTLDRSGYPWLGPWPLVESLEESVWRIA